MQTPAEILKASTAKDHATTEKGLIKHVKNISSATDYANLLYCLYGYYYPLEKSFDEYLQLEVPQYMERRKSERIIQDIETLQLPKPTHTATQLPNITNATQALGCFYVIEGSILGGAVLKKMISGKCPGIPEQAFSFFSGYPNTMELWKSFLAHLNSALSSEERLQEGIAAANDCFTLFGKWIGDYYNLLQLSTGNIRMT